MNNPNKDDQPSMKPVEESLGESFLNHSQETSNLNILDFNPGEVIRGPKYPERIATIAESIPIGLISTPLLDSSIEALNPPLNTSKQHLTNFLDQIDWMNETFELERNYTPVNLGPIRLLKFYKTIIDEVTELLECTNDPDLKEHVLETDAFLEDTDIDEMVSNLLEDVLLTALADTLGDLVVYIFSEARRWGIDLSQVLTIIMQSQHSKLVDGKPLKSADGAKFIKGPYFQPPEPLIHEFLKECLKN